MAQILVIATFIVIFLREAISAPLLVGELGSSRAVAWVTLGVMAGLWLWADVLVRLEAYRMDRLGRWDAVIRAERWIMISRIAGICAHAAAVLALGWLDAVRWFVGDLVFLDEFLATLPMLLLLTGGWWSFYRIERRLREALLIRELDAGRPVHGFPPRWVYVLIAVRHQLALVLAPVLAISAWNELIEHQARHGGSPAAWTALQFGGIAVILSLMPLLLRHIWDTITLGPGALRDRLEHMCRVQRVRVRDLLVWRTSGVMINGAVMGFLGRWRYILLTDALLEHLPQEQVEAVTAHEIGHVRRRHMIWLGVSGIGAVMLAASLIQVATDRIVGRSVPEWLVLAGSSLALMLGMVGFGFVSRRFEWQADAFAVQHLSGATARDRRGVVTPEAVEAMAGALESVARLNHIPKDRFTWRHGSIATRVAKLRALSGQRIDRLRADRDAGAMKIAGLVAIAVALGLAWWSESWLASTPGDGAPETGAAGLVSHKP